jgi:hypothetical protein
LPLQQGRAAATTEGALGDFKHRRTVAAKSLNHHQTQAADKRSNSNVIASNFPKGILPLRALRKLVRSISQIGEQRDDLLHLGYLRYSNSALFQLFPPK